MKKLREYTPYLFRGAAMLYAAQRGVPFDLMEAWVYISSHAIQAWVCAKGYCA